MDKPSTQKAALSVDSKYYWGQDCSRGHGGKRATSNGVCVECVKIREREYYAKNSTRIQARRRELAKEKASGVSSEVADTGSGLPATRQAALAAKAAHYYTGKPCKYGHFSRRRTTSRDCLQCESERGKANGYGRGPAVSAKNRTKHAANPEIQRAKDKARYDKDPGKYIARVMAREAKKLQRTPPWADMAAIRAVYRTAVQMSNNTGTQYHVDHIIPLQGKKVSGLHTVENLQILTQTQNLRKNNQFEIR